MAQASIGSSLATIAIVVVSVLSGGASGSAFNQAFEGISHGELMALGTSALLRGGLILCAWLAFKEGVRTWKRALFLAAAVMSMLLSAFFGPIRVGPITLVDQIVIDSLIVSLIAIRILLRRQTPKGREKQMERSARTALMLINVLDTYGVHKSDAFFIYLPLPRRRRDRMARMWIEILRANDLVRGGPWRIRSEHVSNLIRQMNPELFEGDPTFFETWRVDRDVLRKVFEKLENTS